VNCLQVAYDTVASPCAAANGGGPSPLQSARLVAAVAELGSLGGLWSIGCVVSVKRIMKQILLLIAGSLVAASAFGDSASNNVTVHLGPVAVLGSHTNMWFDCDVSINNQTIMALTVTNLFVMSPGLALKVADAEDKELKRTYAWPLKSWTWTHSPSSQKEFKRLGYGAKPGRNGNVIGISLPETVKTARLQIEGTLSGSTYSGAITSNVVEVKIPE
jgi:hypothetical protein